MPKKATKKRAGRKPGPKRGGRRKAAPKPPAHLQGEGLKEWLKKTKLLSTVGEYVLPAAGGALGGLAGTFEAPVFGTVEGGVLGGIAGTKANEYLKSLGYGNIGNNKGVRIHPRHQYATGMMRSGAGLKRSGEGITRFGMGQRIHKRTEFAT
jgi:hypothetical protein